MSVNPYRVYKYKTWGGSVRTVECDKVEFTAHHVVFSDTRTFPYPHIVLAEKAENVNQLTDVTPRADGVGHYEADGRLK